MASQPEEASSAPQSIQATLAKSRISLDLLSEIEKRELESKQKEIDSKRKKRTKAVAATDAVIPEVVEPNTFDVIIEFNRSFPGGITAARLTLLNAYSKARNELDAGSKSRLTSLVASCPQAARDDAKLVEAFGAEGTLDIGKSLWTDNYVFASLVKETIGSLSAWTIPAVEKPVPLIYKIWLDQKITRCVYESSRTVKCDAAFASFAADGRDIVWAVADTGIDGEHPHFKTLETLILPDGLTHMDFTNGLSPNGALTDTDGHGTHVAGIIAGMTCLEGKTLDTDVAKKAAVKLIKVQIETRNDKGLTDKEIVDRTERISGLAPYCKLLCLKVLQSSKGGNLSNLMAAIGYIQKQNEYGRHIRIHGVNFSLGYMSDAKWFAAGQSPLCVEVDRLVRSGVCVVVAAGNAGYGTVSVLGNANEQATHLGTIADPGNAALAITVGSTHRDMPHSYGISYYSGKGPTSDGRMKPDLVAPGERIVSCDLVDEESAKKNVAPFRVDSGTSMAAPHVSGAVAAFLSVRREFIGQPEVVKSILVQAATDLKRRPEFQGGGLLDLMRALQSV
jgi:serine protease AprX